MTGLSHYLIIISIICDVLKLCSTQSILTPLFRDDELEQVVKDVLKSAPDLKDVISQLERSDFLNQYKSGENNEDKTLNVTELTAKYGFKLQKFPVLTEDGYKITVYRIPGEGDPVLLVHGLMNSAVDWLTIGRENALPYLLADRGYDVWLFNARGSTSDSRGHVCLSAEENPSQYWDFSWHENGYYDLPATIDVILKITGRPKLKYVGHSMGTTAFFVMGSERPEYNDKISLMVALSPVVWMSHIVSPFVRVAAILKNISGIIRHVLGFYVVEANNPVVQILTKYICGNTEVATLLCGNLVFLMSGFDYGQLNATQMPVIFGHTPSSESTKQLSHYAQGIESGKFRNYEYGSIENLKKYGTAEPPDYPVEKVSVPVALFYRRDSDWLSAYEDVLILKKQLPNVVHFYEVPNDKWCHIDYLWAKDVKHFVYDKVLELFEKY